MSQGGRSHHFDTCANELNLSVFYFDSCGRSGFTVLICLTHAEQVNSSWYARTARKNTHLRKKRGSQSGPDLRYSSVCMRGLDAGSKHIPCDQVLSHFAVDFVVLFSPILFVVVQPEQASQTFAEHCSKQQRFQMDDMIDDL